MNISVLAWLETLLIIPSQTKNNPCFHTPGTSPPRMGTMFVYSNIDDLRISDQAMLLLKKIKAGRDSTGDVLWWKCSDGKRMAFSYYGCPYRRVCPNTAIGPRDWRPQSILYTPIPNVVPKEAAIFFNIKDY